MQLALLALLALALLLIVCVRPDLLVPLVLLAPIVSLVLLVRPELLAQRARWLEPIEEKRSGPTR
jgi:hypothetical protein